MYCSYFGLQEAPFSISPNPRYLFMSDRHREALAHLVYGVGVSGGGGFVLLTGEVGTGKTTVSRALLEQLPEDTDVAFILNPYLNAPELLATICDELGIDDIKNRDSLKNLTDSLYQFLLENHAKGRNTVLLIDEAQHLQFDVLEQIRLLTNLETNTKKLLQIIFVGQPELQDLLAKPVLRQLAQRITARFHINPLNINETQAYIRHRLQVGGLAANQTLFSTRLVKEIHRISGGVPRLINVLCDRTLLGTYAQNKPKPDVHTLRQAAKEVLGEQDYIAKKKTHWLPSLAIAVTVVALLGTGLLFWQQPILSELKSEPKLSASQPVKLAPGTESVPSTSSVDVSSKPLFEAAQLHEPVASQLSSSEAEPIAQSALIVVDPIVDKAANEVSIQDALLPNTPQRTVVSQDQTQILTSTALSVTQPLWLSDKHQAISQLLLTVGLLEQHEPNPCQTIANNGIFCEKQTVRNWPEFRSINRPAVLVLNTPSKQVAYTPLVAINDDLATISINGQLQEMAIDELGSLWSGDFIFVWRRPSGFQAPVALGDRAKIVEWLAVKFARLDKRNTLLADEKFSPALAQRVQLFQQQNGLISDGIVGIRTLLKVNEKLGVDKVLGQFYGTQAKAFPATQLARKEAQKQVRKEVPNEVQKEQTFMADQLGPLYDDHYEQKYELELRRRVEQAIQQEAADGDE